MGEKKRKKKKKAEPNCNSIKLTEEKSRILNMNFLSIFFC